MVSRGFTLIELVMVVLLLGILATFSTQFVSISTRIYGDASAREQLMSDARFALERLNRELRDAVPGSVRIEDLTGNAADQGVCLRFWPLATASRYLAMNESVSAASGWQMTMVTPDSNDSEPAAGQWAVVYPIVSGTTPIEQGCVNGTCVAEVTSVASAASGAQSVMVNAQFAADSPARRVFLADQQSLYCISGGQLLRGSAALGTTLDGSALTEPMAGMLASDSYFYRDQAAFNLDSGIGLRLTLTRSDETVVLDHKMAVFNVP